VRIAVLAKQVPAFAEMTLGTDGRLRRAGVPLEMNPYCRRAVARAVAWAEERPGVTITVLCLGPEEAEDVVREAIAWGLDRGAAIDGVLVTDPAFAGSDTLATARALAAAIEHTGPFDLVLTGRNSVDADTGQVPPELAELLGLPFLTGIREVTLTDTALTALCEHDDGWVEAEVTLPAVASCAERLIDPAKVDPSGRAAVPATRIRRLTATDLGPGPWGAAGSPTWVGPVREIAPTRAGEHRPDLPLAEQVARAVAVLRERGALDSASDSDAAPRTVPAPRPDAPVTAVLAEPGRDRTTRELLGAAATLTGAVRVIVIDPPDPATLAARGADEIVHLTGPTTEAAVARAAAPIVADAAIVLAPSTAWGREVAGRIAARLGAGLTGDAVELDADGNGRLTAWKPAFGGRLVAAIGTTGAPQMATVRAGVLPLLVTRSGSDAPLRTVPVAAVPGVEIRSRARDDDLDRLADATAVIGIGRGVDPDEYAAVEPLRVALGAELAATRKVTDRSWMPRACQIGITGRSIAPRLFVSIGASGKFNHMVGVRSAGTVLAINSDPEAPVFAVADIGIVGDWRDAVALLSAALT